MLYAGRFVRQWSGFEDRVQYAFGMDEIGVCSIIAPVNTGQRAGEPLDSPAGNQNQP